MTKTKICRRFDQVIPNKNCITRKEKQFDMVYNKNKSKLQTISGRYILLKKMEIGTFEQRNLSTITFRQLQNSFLLIVNFYGQIWLLLRTILRHTFYKLKCLHNFIILISENTSSYKICIMGIPKFVNKNQLILYLFNIYFNSFKYQINSLQLISQIDMSNLSIYFLHLKLFQIFLKCIQISFSLIVFTR